MTTWSAGSVKKWRSPSLLLFLPVLALGVILSLSGCSGLTSAGTPSNNTSGTSATLASNTTSVNFQNVPVGTSVSQGVTLTNMGNTAITISQATVTGAGFSLAGQTSSMSLAAGQSQSLQVQFSPTSTGTSSGGVDVDSDAKNSKLHISLNGNGVSSISITTQPASQTVTAGQSATFSVIASGKGSLTYQWEKNGVAISGATAASYTTPATTSADNGAQFVVVVTDTNGSQASTAATLTVTAAPVAPSITTQPANQTVAAGQTASFSVTATGTTPLTYQWSKNGSAISGASAASYTTPATTASDSGAQFTVTITNSVGSATSNAATLTVNVPPTITTQPASVTVTAGQTATFAVVATGTGTLTYQWKKNGVAISGATSASYTTAATTASDNGAQFTVVVTGNTGSITSSAATLTVNVAPTISGQPASVTVVAGQTATFSVTAAGTSPLTYQWNKNGTAISGATSSSYTTPATTASDSGAQFTVTVTNSVGSVTSNAATLTVNVPPTITTQPAGQTVLAGQTATFSVSATGTGTLTYQWKKNGVAISGATSASYTTAATTASDNGAQFTVVVTDNTGSVTSSAATLTVNVPPSISGQPASVTVTAGQTATFTVTATGTAPLSYQWSKNGSAISGATSSSYTTPATTASDSGAQFTVTITNSVGSVTSNAATLTVNVPPTISTQPASVTVTAGQTATFSVSATGTGTLTYQWKKNGVAISGATSASYTTAATTASDNGAQFTVVVTDNTGSITSSAATLTVNVPPSISGQPASVTVTAGQTATFTVTASGTAPLSYQWSKNGSAISGATSSSYTTPATTASDSGAQFTVTVTNSVGSVTSNAATLTVNVPPTISAQPASVTVLAGQTATFSVSATGTGTLTYQWKKNGVAISGATSTSYTTAATTGTDNGAQFTVVVTDNTGSITSSAATLTVNVPPSISGQPASVTVVAGQTATFTVTATGTAPLSYQWSKNGTAISGATSSSYTTPATTASDNGAQFRVTVTNSVGSVTSNAATLTVNATTLVLNPSTTSLNFSNVNVGSNSVLPVTFTNAGNASVTISGVSISGAGYSAAGIQSGQIIPAGQTATLNVTFTPGAAGTVTGGVTVSSNATNSPATISLSGTGVQGGSNGPGWTYLQDVITTGGGSCVGGSSTCTIDAMLPTTAGSVIVVVAKTQSSVTISSVTGGGTWTHCTTCHVNNATINLDASYSVNVPGGTTAITVNLSGSTTGFFQVTLYEILPPSGSTASLDAASTASGTSCTTCTAVGLSTSATDAIIQIQAGASVAGWDAWSSPYLTDAHGNGLYLNATSGSAPTMKATSSTNVVFIGMAFKSSLGSFTPPTQSISLVNYAVFPATGGLSVTCSPTCTLTVPATGANHLLYIQSADETGSFISAVSGGGTGWVIPSGCAIKISSGSSSGGALSCAYLLSSTAGATSISVTMTGNPTSGAFAVWELGGGNGSFAVDGAPGSATRAGYPATTAGGVGLTLTGTDDVIFQAALIEGGSTGVTLYPVPYINGQAQNFFNNAALQSALLNTTNGTAPIWINGGQNSAIVVTGIAFQLSNASTLVLNPSTTSLDFSNVSVGSNSVLPVTFTNAGNSSVTISSSSGVTVSGAGYSASGIQSGQIIPAGQTATLNVTFAPAATGTVSGSVTVASDATNSPATISLTGAGVQSVQHSASLSWTASTSTVSGYNVYESTVTGGPYTKMNTSLDTSLSYTDSNVSAGQTYFFVVTAVDSSGMESAFSNEASTTVP